MSIIAQKRRRDIYMFDGGEGRQYIGQSVNLKKRIGQHRSEAKKGINTALYNFARKHGWDALSLRVLATGWWTDEQANDAEEGYIAYHDTFHNGLNETKGGGGTTGRVPSQEWCNNHSARMAGENNPNYGRKFGPPSAEKRAKISDKLRGRKRSPESIAKTVEKNRGQKRSPETRAKISYAIRLRNYENNGTMKIF